MKKKTIMWIVLSVILLIGTLIIKDLLLIICSMVMVAIWAILFAVPAGIGIIIANPDLFKEFRSNDRIRTNSEKLDELISSVYQGWEARKLAAIERSKREKPSES